MVQVHCKEYQSFALPNLCDKAVAGGRLSTQKNNYVEPKVMGFVVIRKITDSWFITPKTKSCHYANFVTGVPGCCRHDNLWCPL